MSAPICDQCETVAHCTRHGCIPVQPARVAKVGQRLPDAEPLPPSQWRRELQHLARWVLIVILALVGAALFAGVFHA